MRNIFITGSAGFVGLHLAKRFLEAGHQVMGVDCFTDYYDVGLKKARHRILTEYDNFQGCCETIENFEALEGMFKSFKPDIAIHLAAQAGVRYSLENPRAYVSANIVGTFNLMECARLHGLDHLVMASTSSVYGATRDMPFKETSATDLPLTIYAATKKSNEVMAHSYAHLYNIPTTMLRFFTVYGPYGRPDMAPMLFAKNIVEGRAIDVFNHGDMYRDFTFVDDLAQAIYLITDHVPQRADGPEGQDNNTNLSPVAPYRVLNIGNSTSVKLLDFIEALEDALGIKARCNMMEMQAGDVPATWADCSVLMNLTDYSPRTDIKTGVQKFVAWYKDYYKI